MNMQLGKRKNIRVNFESFSGIFNLIYINMFRKIAQLLHNLHKKLFFFAKQTNLKGKVMY